VSKYATGTVGVPHAGDPDVGITIYTTRISITGFQVWARKAVQEG
jgi:hypothetical protein